MWWDFLAWTFSEFIEAIMSIIASNFMFECERLSLGVRSICPGLTWIWVRKEIDQDSSVKDVKNHYYILNYSSVIIHFGTNLSRNECVSWPVSIDKQTWPLSCWIEQLTNIFIEGLKYNNALDSDLTKLGSKSPTDKLYQLNTLHCIHRLARMALKNYFLTVCKWISFW